MVTSVSYLLPSDGGTLQLNVHKASITVLTAAVGINGHLLSVLLLHCVHFVI